MQNISFTSNIRLVSPNEYSKSISKISHKNFVDFPWTLKESVLADSAFTKDVFDCSVCGLTDGQDVLLMHLCPTSDKNKSFAKIEKFIEKKLWLGNPDLQGFILGGKFNNINSPRSIKLNESFEKFMIKHNIPYSLFRGGDFANNVSYSSKTDEWLISNELIKDDMKEVYKNPLDILSRIFDKIKISKLDELSW
jgi:hypothetical protein